MRVRKAFALYLAAVGIAGAVSFVVSSQPVLYTLGAAILFGLVLTNFFTAKKMVALERRLVTHLDSMLPQIQSMVEITSMLPLRTPLPPLGGWAISHDFASSQVSILLDRKPALVVELGSGSSTILSSYCLEKNGNGGSVIALDHEAKFAAATRTALDRHGFTDIATVIHAPLKECDVRGRKHLWYDLSALRSIRRPIDVLIIDGPPQSTQKEARYPALPLLRDLLAPDAIILLDDADRPDERKAVSDWLAECPGFELDRLPHLKGTVILRRTAAERMMTG